MDKITFKTITIEVLSVVFAVLLALGLNNWWKERSNEKLGEEALQNIINEMNRNMIELDTAILELNIQLDTLLKEKEDYQNGIDSSLSLGYAQTVLSKTAWQTANITQAVHYMESDLIMQISNLYTVQELYDDFSMNYFKIYSSLEFNKPENDLVALNSNIKQVQLSISFATQLKTGYKEFFDEFNEQIPEPQDP